MPKDEPTHQPARAIAGHCPVCLRLCIVFNNHEVWPLVVCECGWKGGTDQVGNRTRYERGGYVEDVWGSGRRA